VRSIERPRAAGAVAALATIADGFRLPQSASAIPSQAPEPATIDSPCALWGNRGKSGRGFFGSYFLLDLAMMLAAIILTGVRRVSRASAR
jgi:hypothetical protein